jgi:hypothetical protein
MPGLFPRFFSLVVVTGLPDVTQGRLTPFGVLLGDCDVIDESMNAVLHKADK